jgi:hypothetical protein
VLLFTPLKNGTVYEAKRFRPGKPDVNVLVQEALSAYPGRELPRGNLKKSDPLDIKHRSRRSQISKKEVKKGRWH